jgi:hypothetical protein
LWERISAIHTLRPCLSERKLASAQLASEDLAGVTIFRTVSIPHRVPKGSASVVVRFIWSGQINDFFVEFSAFHWHLHFVFATCAIFYFIKWTLYSSHQQIENWKAQTNFFCLKQKQSWQLLCLSGNTSSSFSRQLYQLSKTYIDLAFNANWQDIF